MKKKNNNYNRRRQLGSYSFLLYKFLKKDLSMQSLFTILKILVFFRKYRNNFFIAAITKFLKNILLKILIYLPVDLK